MSRVFSNFTLKLGLKQGWPLVIFSKDNGKVEGLLYDLWLHVTRSIGLSWKEFRLNYSDASENWREIYQHLVNKEPKVDVIVMPALSKLTDIEVTFSAPYDYTSTVLITNLRGQCEINAYNQFPHVTNSIVLATSLLILAISIVIYVNERKMGILTYYLTLVIILIRQPLAAINPTKTPARIATAFLLLGLFPLITTFLNEMRANLVSCSERIPNTFGDLLKMNRMAAIPRHSTEYFNLKNSSYSNARILAKKIEESNGLLDRFHLDISEHEQVFLKDKRTLIASALPFLFNLGQLRESGKRKEIFDRLNLRFGSKWYFMRTFCIPERNDLPKELLDLINTRILYYVEVGLYQIENRKLMEKVFKSMGRNIFSELYATDTSSLEPVKLFEIASLFNSWAIGLTLSTCILIIEILNSLCF